MINNHKGQIQVTEDISFKTEEYFGFLYGQAGIYD